MTTTETTYQFGTKLYDSREEMLAGAVHQWMTEDAWFNATEIERIGISETGLFEAGNMIDDYGLDDDLTWMQDHGITREELAAAIVKFWHDHAEDDAGTNADDEDDG